MKNTILGTGCYENITLRKLKDDLSDYRLLEKWYQEEAIYAHFEQRKLNLEEIVKKYRPRTKADATVPVYMIEYERNAVGIIQYQLISKENKKLYDIKENVAYEIDIFIGELNFHNKGIGQKSVNLMAEYLFKTKEAELLVMCPMKNNINAIKCYQNSGFKVITEFKTEDTIGCLQHYILMTRKK